MTDDHLEKLREKCEGKKDITLPALDLLNIIDMVQNYGADLDRLYKDLADQQNELDTLRKVVWHLERDEVIKAFVLRFVTTVDNNLDIAKLQREMGK